jgi:acetyl esterase/lipase
MTARFKRLLLVAGLTSSASFSYAAEGFEIPLWPERKLAEGAAEEKIVERGKDKSDRSIRNVSSPAITIYLPSGENASGAAIVICPGGGYGSLAIDKEGHDVARWLNTIGIAGVVLKYRLPVPVLSKSEIPLPLQDAQQALRLVRSRAAEWKLDPARIGIIGFSAGGHLAATASTHYDAGKPDSALPLERLSCKPDFSILVYPVVSMREGIGHNSTLGALLGKAPDPKLVEEYSNELHVDAKTPPAFLVHAKDDGVKAENSILYSEALKKAGVACELMLFEKGGHGYGLGVRGGEPAAWPAKCAEWLKAQKILPATK